MVLEHWSPTCKNNFTDIIISKFLPWTNYKIEFQLDQKLNMKSKSLKRNYNIIIGKISYKIPTLETHERRLLNINVAYVISKRAYGTKTRSS